MTTAVKKVFDSALKSAIPKGALTISEWAEQYRYVSPQRSARPGLWKNDVVPFARGIMDAVTEPMVRKIVLMKSSQVAGTEIIINILCYFIHMDPSLMLYIAEIEDKARAWTNEAFDPTIAESPELNRCFFGGIADRSADNNQRVKRFKGGQLTIGWASSPAQLSSRPARVVCFDEVDAFEPTAEGDAVKLAEARTKTFGDSKKIILVSSPRDKENSIIEREFLGGDQREFYVPCPQCDELQTLKWGGPDAAFGVKWDEDEPENAWYLCEFNGCVIEQDEKQDMLSKGRWLAGAEFRGTASFKINEIYSPFTNWGDMATAWLEAKKHRDTLKVFVNTSLGETWEEEGEKIEFDDLNLLRDDYANEVPLGVQFLTAGVDVQNDRLECEVVGWGRDNESWSIDYQIFQGSPSLDDVWDELEAYLRRPFIGIDREFHIKAACIDSGGDHTDEVYRFCKKHAMRRWFAVKGLSTPGNPLVNKPTRNNRIRVKLFGIGTDTAKDEIFSYLRVGEAGKPGACHFPDREPYDEAYFKQLACSEVKRTKFVQGRAVKYYAKVSEAVRNEALDVRVYASAAREIVYPRSRKRRSADTPVRDRAEHDEETPEAPNGAAAEASIDASVEADKSVRTPPAEPKKKVRKVRSFRSSRF